MHTRDKQREQFLLYLNSKKRKNPNTNIITTNTKPTRKTMTTTGLTSPQDSNPNNAVDAARDSTYCPQEPLTTTQQPPPRPAPRGHPPVPKPRSVLPPAPPSSQIVETLKKEERSEAHGSPRSKQRLIKVDFSLLQDDTYFDDSPASGSSSIIQQTSSICSQPKMPPYPIGGYMPATAAPTNNMNTKVVRRTSI